MSPGTTGRLNLHVSMPPKKKFCCADASRSGSIITIPPSCAKASTCSTPAWQHGHQLGTLSTSVTCMQLMLSAMSSAIKLIVQIASIWITWHDLPIREVPREEVVVCSHVLVTNRIFLGFKLHYSVEQQKGESATGSCNFSSPCCHYVVTICFTIHMQHV